MVVERGCKHTEYSSDRILLCGVIGCHRCEEELPEKCIGVIRLVNLDLDGAEPLEEPKIVADAAGSPVSTANGGAPPGSKGTSPLEGGNEGQDRNGARERVSPGAAFRMTAPASMAAGGVSGRAVATNA